MLPVESIAQRIITIRGLRVMLDSDLAALYEVPTKRFNEAVKRNANRFPSDFMVQLTEDEWASLRSQFATLNANAPTGDAAPRRGQHRKYLPYVFTEHGALMAAMILKSERAVEVSVYVVRAFVQLRSLLAANDQLAAQLKALEKRIAQRLSTHDQAITGIIDTLRKLMQANEQRDSAAPTKRPIGFIHPEEKPPRTPQQRVNRGAKANAKVSAKKATK